MKYENINYGSELKRRKETFDRAMNAEGMEFKRIFQEVLTTQKQDGSFSLIEEYRIDADSRVAYGYVPTYYGTAIFMKADLKYHFERGTKEYAAFEKALNFSAGRNLKGAGYSETEGMIEAFHIFMKAGLFQWMNQTKFQDNVFVACIHDQLKKMEKEIDHGDCIHDWNHDFTKEFSEIMKEYYKNTQVGERMTFTEKL